MSIKGEELMSVRRRCFAVGTFKITGNHQYETFRTSGLVIAQDRMQMRGNWDLSDPNTA